MESEMTTTITGLFDTYDQGARAVSDMEAAGVPHSDISIVSNDPVHSSSGVSGAGTGATIGAVLGGGAGLLAGLGLLAIPGLGPVVAAGWLASTAVGAVAVGAAGGIVGALTDAGVSEEEAHVCAEGVRRGGTLVSARVDETRTDIVRGILAQHNAVDVEERGATYRSAGPERFKEDAPPLDTRPPIKTTVDH
jgi:hypothetical protein